MGLDMTLTVKTGKGEKEIYWRKANHVHKWFVDNVQDKKDDCGEYKVEVSKLKELLKICKKIKADAIMKKGKIKEGMILNKERGWKNIIKDGEIIKNPKLAKKLLPTAEGFFFGSFDYDQYYMNIIDHTIKELTKIFEEYKKETTFTYNSSW